MKIQILSDLHNEFLINHKSNSLFKWKGKIESTSADLIILAGDIDTGIRGVTWAIEESERLAVPIIYVVGNHEYYNYEINKLKENLLEVTKNTNVFLLNPGTHIFNDIRIIGATLWTDYKAFTTATQSSNIISLKNSLSDHRLINIQKNGNVRKFSPHDALDVHKKEIKWLIEQLEKPFDGKTVIVTHHGPHAVCQHKSYTPSPISSGFYSDLSLIIESYSIDTWIYGHTHSNLNTRIENTRIISNQAGYPDENVFDFDPSFLLDI